MAAFEGWAVVELLGHRVRYGRVTEVTLFGESMFKIEMPVLRDVRTIAEPVPCRGMQGFWTLPDDIERAVKAQIARSS